MLVVRRQGVISYCSCEVVLSFTGKTKATSVCSVILELSSQEGLTMHGSELHADK